MFTRSPRLQSGLRFCPAAEAWERFRKTGEATGSSSRASSALAAAVGVQVRWEVWGD